MFCSVRFNVEKYRINLEIFSDAECSIDAVSTHILAALPPFLNGYPGQETKSLRKRHGSLQK